MAKKIKIFMFDTETAGTLGQALVYDFGAQIIDLRGNRIHDCTSNWINYDVFYKRADQMETAYYAEKLPAYRDEIWAGEREVFDLLDIRARVHKILKDEGITVVCAHNAQFDINALNYTVRTITNGRVRYFFPYNVEVWDTLKMARQILPNMPTYQRFCENNGFMTNHKTPRVRLTAEVIYRYITGDVDFEEAHTGLKDVEIESIILGYLNRQHKKIDRVLYHAPERA